MSTRTTTRTATAAASVVLHGSHPLRGYAVTWHVTPVPGAGRGGAAFLVERADGTITDDLAWQLAEKDRQVMSAHEACALVRRVTAGRR